MTPAAICRIQTFGDFLGFNPHLHILAADGCFKDNCTFYAAGASLNVESLEPLFRHKILFMLKSRGLITDRAIEQGKHGNIIYTVTNRDKDCYFSNINKGLYSRQCSMNNFMQKILFIYIFAK